MFVCVVENGATLDCRRVVQVLVRVAESELGQKETAAGPFSVLLNRFEHGGQELQSHSRTSLFIHPAFFLLHSFYLIQFSSTTLIYEFMKSIEKGNKYDVITDDLFPVRIGDEVVCRSEEPAVVVNRALPYTSYF